MQYYQKINSIFLRDPENNMKTFLYGHYSIPEFEYLKDAIWTHTEKVDGTSIVVSFEKDKLVVGGHTEVSQIPPFVLKTINDLLLPQMEKLQKMFPTQSPVYFYGEGYGPKVNKKGKLYREDHGFVMFDVFINDLWLARENVEDIGNKLGIDVVPIIGYGTLDDAIIKTKAGFKSQWGDFIAEGIVAKPKVELQCRRGSRIITKVKYKDFTKESGTTGML